jgi:hypothetical protein
MRIAWAERDARSIELAWVVDAVQLVVKMHVEATILQFSVLAAKVSSNVVLTHIWKSRWLF